MNKHRRFGTSFLLSILAIHMVAVGGVLFAEETPWHVTTAPIRFRLGVGTSPSHKSAGYFVILPDGGILPGPNPTATVITESGKKLNAYTMWHNKECGLGIIFDDPGGGDLWVYVSKSATENSWTEKSGLTPGLLRCIVLGRGDQKGASAMARCGEVADGVVFERSRSFSAGGNSAQLCVMGDYLGRAGACSIYTLGYLDVPHDGKTWIAPQSLQSKDGPAVQCITLIDGKQVTPAVRTGAWGGIGQWMDLSKGLHKVEMLAWAGSGYDPAKSGFGYLAWAPPKTTEEDLGGKWGEKAPEPGMVGKVKQAAYCVRNDQLVKSGSCEIREINMKDSGPVAYFTADAVENFWYGDETPIFTYELKAFTAGNAKDAIYTWAFGNNVTIDGQGLAWFFPGKQEKGVSLTVQAGGKTSRYSKRICAYSDVESDLDDASTRANFRVACLSMIKAYPEDADPTITWNKSMWQTLYDVMEFGKGQALLAEILTKRWQFFKDKVPLEKQMVMEDIFFNWISPNNPDTAIDWLQKQSKASSSAERRKDLDIMQSEVYMYQLGNFEAARKLLKPIAGATGESAAMAGIRLGDLAFLEKDLNAATKYWGMVQNRVKLTKDMINGAGSGVEWASPDDGEKKKKKQAEEKSFVSAVKGNEKVDDWKKSAVLDTSMSSSVITLMAQDDYLDAYNELRRWERNFPLSKISGDYILQEAKFYLSTGNSKRARKLLETYCENVDASSYLADAAGLLLECMMKDKEPDAVLKKFCEDMKKRFEFHPIAERMGELLKIIGADGVKREATLDKF